MPRKGIVVVPPQASAGAAAATHPVANRPIVCHVVDALRSAGVNEVAIVGASDALGPIRRSISDDINGSGDELAYLPLNGRRDLIGTLHAAAGFVGGAPAVIHSAIGVVGQPLTPFADLLRSEQADLMLLLHRSPDPLDRLGPEVERVLGITQLNGTKARLGLAGVCLLGPGALDRCLQVPEPQGDLYLPAVAERIARSGKRVQAGFVQTWRCYGGKPLDLLELNRIVLDQQIVEEEPSDGDDNRIEGRVVIHPTAEVTSSVVLGPSIIGPHARVTSSYVGPYTSIGAGARIEGAEIERSIVLDDARIMHISGRIEASTVGRRASIFRDFGLPRALRLHVGDDDEVALN